jgi:hypothetical protein
LVARIRSIVLRGFSHTDSQGENGGAKLEADVICQLFAEVGIGGPERTALVAL